MRILRSVVAAAVMIGAREHVNGDDSGTFTVWRPVNSKFQGRFRRVLEMSPSARIVTIDHGALNSAIRPAFKRRRSISKHRNNDHTVSLNFPLRGDEDDEDVKCELAASDLMAPELQSKFPEIQVLSGICGPNGNRAATVVMDANTPGSFSATVESSSGELFYVDHSAGDEYGVYKYKDSKRRPDEFKWRCSGITDDDTENSDREYSAHDNNDNAILGGRTLRERNLAIEPNVHVFRLAILATKEYSQYHGNTNTSVMTAIASMMSRVNGVFIRELGIFFQLIGNNDKIICLNGDTSCANWENTIDMINKIMGQMADRGVPSLAYDLGHAVSTGGGGLAGYGVLCNSNAKGHGVTGSSSPINDPFWVDYVVHEIGHQIKGAHTFRDCGGTSTNYSPDSGVEPGSGSSIMGYAGLCGKTNLQSNSDPNFNAVNLVRMRAWADSEVSRGCGATYPITDSVKPVMVSVTSTCVLPKGNFLQLSGSPGNTQPDGSSLVYAWDRVDRGESVFEDENIPRFRAWPPNNSPKRFLPNMYYLSFGRNADPNAREMDEIAPKASIAGDVTMEFSFVGRTRFSKTATIPAFSDVRIAGSFGIANVDVRYQASSSPLTFTSVPSSLTGSTSATFYWSGALDLASEVELMIAINTMDKVSSFKHEMHLHDLEWISMGVVPNNRQATVNVPYLTNPSNRKVNVMLRSTGSEYCYFFDLMPMITYTSGQPGKPTPSPTTLAPVFVSTIPSEWICKTSYFDSRDGCDCGCGGATVEDPDCARAYTDLYCGINGKSANSATATCVQGKCVPLVPSPFPTLYPVFFTGPTPVANPVSSPAQGEDKGNGTSLTFSTNTLAIASASCVLQIMIMAALFVTRAIVRTRRHASLVRSLAHSESAYVQAEQPVSSLVNPAQISSFSSTKNTQYSTREPQ